MDQTKRSYAKTTGKKKGWDCSPDSSRIYLLPAWPENLEVHFKLHAAYNTTVEVRSYLPQDEKILLLHSGSNRTKQLLRRRILINNQIDKTGEFGTVAGKDCLILAVFIKEIKKLMPF